LLWKHIFFISKSVLYLRFWLCNKLLHFGIYMICIYMLKHFIWVLYLWIPLKNSFLEGSPTICCSFYCFKVCHTIWFLA
jgi:hypothetical protein